MPRRSGVLNGYPSVRAAIFSVNSYIAAMLSLLIAFAISLDRPFWALTTVYITSQPLSGAVRSKAVYRLVGTLVVLAIFSPPQLVWLSPILAGLILAPVTSRYSAAPVFGRWARLAGLLVTPEERGDVSALLERLAQVAVEPSVTVEHLDFTALAVDAREYAVNAAATRAAVAAVVVAFAELVGVLEAVGPAAGRAGPVAVPEDARLDAGRAQCRDRPRFGTVVIGARARRIGRGDRQRQHDRQR